MSIRFRHKVPAFLPLATIMLAITPALAGSWQNSFSGFGASIAGDLYTPTTPGTNPAIMVAMHYCGGSASDAQGWFKSAADQYGFYIITPHAGAKCFNAYATRDASKEPAQIVKMVQWVITNKNADASRVFSAGYSSGGCMTNTLLAIYPDVFAGGAALPGYPAGSWAQTDTTCQMCGAGGPTSSDTGQKYADLVKGVFSFSGTRPCVQEWVGGSDAYSFADWLPVVVSEFQILGNLGSATTPSSAPSGWTRQEYKDSSGNVRLQTNVKPGQGHNLIGVVDNNEVVKFLGLDKPTGACGITTSAGGASSTGGASSVAAGGTKAAGGASSVPAGGSSAAEGGTKAAGGATAAGGTSSAADGGTKAAVGASTAGGTQAAGGASAAGGTKAAGGASAAGGTKAAGGASAAGGANTTTTSAAVGGNGTTTTTAAAETGGSSTAASTDQTAAGGSSNAAEGGGVAAGGNAAVGGASVISSTSGTSNDQGGCGCRVAGNHDRSGALWGLGLLGAAVAAWRRRQRKIS